MQAHLTCLPVDLEKNSQNLIQKLIERGQSKRARQQSEEMLVRLVNMISASRPGNKSDSSREETDKENFGKANKKVTKPTNSSLYKGNRLDDWKDALKVLTETPDACRNAPKDETILVVSCLSNLATFALQRPPEGCAPHPVLSMCGSGCLRWLQHLAVLDVATSQRLAGSLYRITSKAAAVADDGDKAHDIDAALQLRELSLVYLAASGKVGVSEVVAQAVKTAKFYDAKPSVRGTSRMALFHSRLLDRLAPVLLQLVNGGGEREQVHVSANTCSRLFLKMFVNNGRSDGIRQGFSADVVAICTLCTLSHICLKRTEPRASRLGIRICAFPGAKFQSALQRRRIGCSCERRKWPRWRSDCRAGIRTENGGTDLGHWR